MRTNFGIIIIVSLLAAMLILAIINKHQFKKIGTELTETKTELEQTKAELESTQDELKFGKSEFGSIQAELEQTKAELEQTKSKLKSAQLELEQTKLELEQTKTELEQTQAELGQLMSTKSIKVLITSKPEIVRTSDNCLLLDIRFTGNIKHLFPVKITQRDSRAVFIKEIKMNAILENFVSFSRLTIIDELDELKKLQASPYLQKNKFITIQP